jgi:DNA-binding SARP family transcriptional activator
LAFETVGAGHPRDLDPEAGDVRWQILGPVAATRQGAALDLGAPRQRAVLTLLLSRAGDTVPLSRIVEAVWGLDPPRYAVNTVHKHVGALRRVVEPGLPRRARGHWLRSDARGYRITADEHTLDLLRFRALAARARHRRDPAERLDLFGAARSSKR